MDWLRRNDPFEYDKDRIAAGSGYYPAAEHVATSRSVSMDPGRSVGYGTETPEIFELTRCELVEWRIPVVRPLLQLS